MENTLRLYNLKNNERDAKGRGDYF